MKKKIIFIVILIIALSIIIGAVLLRIPTQSDPAAQRSVTVQRGDLVVKALAVGTIQPETEIQIKSKISGVVDKIFAEPGTFVRQGDPVLEIKPDPTPLELAETKRNVELANIQMENTERELERSRTLWERALISEREYEDILRRYYDASIRLQMMQERLQLIESGRVMIGDTKIESIIKAPITGHILEKMVDIGDPVVPLTTFQAGTPLMTMASMENLIFRGTVDEIDVGKLKEGMEADIKIGALPEANVRGELTKISLKARRQDNATVFPVEIVITEEDGATLRAGYSANADIIIHKKTNSLLIPERVVSFRDGNAFVYIADGDGGSKEIEIVTGISDAINIEVVSGLNEGDRVLERQAGRVGR